MTTLAAFQSLIAVGESDTVKFDRSSVVLRSTGETLRRLLTGDCGQALVDVGPKGQLVSR